MWQGLMYKHGKACPAGGLVEFCGAPGYFQGISGLWGLLSEPNQPCHGGQPGRRGGSCSSQLGLELPITELGIPHKGFSVQGPFLVKKFRARLEKS